MRIGLGYDIHRLVKGLPLILGGVEIPFPKGLEGHSDADVLLHAVCDSILGAIGEGDIGSRFPDTDPRYKGISSRDLLKEVMVLMESKGLKINNLDCVVVAEEPKISPYRDKMIDTMAGILRLPPDALSIKGKTGEKLGDVGKGAAIVAQAAVLLVAK